jgi:hypothetical protein
MSISTATGKNALAVSARHKLAKTAAALTIVAAATLAVPTAAHAYADLGPDALLSSSTVTPGGSVEFSATPDTFEPGETVTVTLEGENASAATMAMIRAAAVERQVLGERTATADGSLAPVTITLPANASGPYTVIATSPSLPQGVSASFTVSSAVAADGTSNTAAENALPPTGIDANSLLGLWVGGGALVLAGGAIAVGATVRRHQNNTAL